MMLTFFDVKGKKIEIFIFHINHIQKEHLHSIIKQDTMGNKKLDAKAEQADKERKIYNKKEEKRLRKLKTMLAPII